MLKDTDLHLYLNEAPVVAALEESLVDFSFILDREVDRTKAEPHTYFFSWVPDDSPGFQLIYFDTLFADDLNFGKFQSFAILSASQDSTDSDMDRLDTVAAHLLDVFGGHLHNPQRIERISTSYFLSGEQFIAQKVEDRLA